MHSTREVLLSAARSGLSGRSLYVACVREIRVPPVRAARNLNPRAYNRVDNTRRYSDDFLTTVKALTAEDPCNLRTGSELAVQSSEGTFEEQMLHTMQSSLNFKYPRARKMLLLVWSMAALKSSSKSSVSIHDIYDRQSLRRPTVYRASLWWWSSVDFLCTHILLLQRKLFALSGLGRPVCLSRPKSICISAMVMWCINTSTCNTTSVQALQTVHEQPVACLTSTNNTSSYPNAPYLIAEI